MTKISWSEMIETTLVVALLSAISNQGKAASESTDTARGQTNEYDVVVIGGTPAGIAAAIAAGRAGKTVIVIEQTPVLGGVLSSGVIRLDDPYVESNSGVMEEFRQRVRTYHRTKLADDPLVKAHKKLDPRFPWNVAEGRAWEPHTAARIYAELVAEVKAITTRFNEVAVGVKIEREADHRRDHAKS
jgi:flavin-dependent dehydrogenase